VSGRRLVAYVQLTQGPPHLARVRALDAQPGWRCRAIELASRERTRLFQLDAGQRAWCDTLLEGVYEDLPLRRRLLAVRRYVARERPDAVIVDQPADPVQRAMAFWVRRRGGVAFARWASTQADYSRARWREMLKGFVYRGFDGYLATGTRAADYLASFGIDRARVHVCGNPVDSETFTRARDQRSPVAREPCFLFVGRFLPHKNLPAFVRAYARYRTAGGGWDLRIVGFGEQEPQTRAAARGVPGIAFLGHLDQKQLLDLYGRCGALVLPSISENWGLVVNEAMHSGMPILLSTRCGCFPELLEEGRNGFALDPTRVESMTAALARFAALPPGERAAMGARSVEIAAGHTPEAWARHVARALGGGTHPR